MERSHVPHGAPPRPRWEELPEHVRSGIEGVLGGAVVASESKQGGFSPGVASVVQLADGAQWFVKAVGTAANPVSPELHRCEARVAAQLPDDLPVPRLQHVWDDGDWVALVFDAVRGRTPVLPWRREELDAVLDALVGLSRRLTPAPFEAPRLADDPGFTGFRQLRRAREGGDTLADLDPWVVAELDRLSRVEEGWSGAVDGETLLHLDLRADNILLGDDGDVWFVDWPHVTVGAAWVDLLGMLPSVAAQGGPGPWDVFGVHPLSRDVDQDRAAAAVAGLAGFFLFHSRLPPHPGLPTVRRFQRTQADHALRWLRRLLERHA